MCTLLCKIFKDYCVSYPKIGTMPTQHMIKHSKLGLTGEEKLCADDNFT